MSASSGYHVNMKGSSIFAFHMLWFSCSYDLSILFESWYYCRSKYCCNVFQCCVLMYSVSQQVMLDIYSGSPLCALFIVVIHHIPLKIHILNIICSPNMQAMSLLISWWCILKEMCVLMNYIHCQTDTQLNFNTSLHI